ncbi:hypothetical protein AB0L65_06330 [Nonomuraea sp. NPDC052116]|uniref:hypothetical protein n=1 Tax=Nonomuraea sp. NPDC052116 TaxID=3155665 RepID=UPI0034369271
MGNVLRALAAAAAGAIVLAGIATPAHAEVWNCFTSVNTTTNVAGALCASGFGSYRVAAKCNSAHYPYTRTIVGPWVTKVSGQQGTWSTASGDAQGCHVVEASTQVR